VQGRVGEGLKLATNVFEYGLDSQQYIVVPESEHFITIRHQPARSFGVVLRTLDMLPAIQFNYQPRLETSEISNVAGDWKLTTKLAAKQLTPA
jgi:hypothetical protein